MPFQLRRVRAENLFRFKSIDVPFYPDDRVILLGENRDSGGMDSNEAGKSTFVNVISWVQYKFLPETITLGEILRPGAESGFGEVSYENGDGTPLVVTRRLGKNSGLSFIHGDREVSGREADVEAELALVLGLDGINRQTYDDFLATAYLTDANIHSLIGVDDTPSSRLEAVTRILGLTVLDRAASLAHKEAGTIEKGLADPRARVGFFEETMPNANALKAELGEAETEKEALEQKVGECEQQMREIGMLEAKEAEFPKLRKRVADLEEEVVKLLASLEKVHSFPASHISRPVLEVLRDSLSGEVEQLDAEHHDFWRGERFRLQTKLDVLEDRIRREYIKAEGEGGMLCPACEAPLVLTVDGKLELYDLEMNRVVKEEAHRLAKAAEEKAALVTAALACVNDLLVDIDADANYAAEQGKCLMTVLNTLGRTSEVGEGLATQLKERLAGTEAELGEAKSELSALEEEVTTARRKFGRGSSSSFSGLLSLLKTTRQQKSLHALRVLGEIQRGQEMAKQLSELKERVLAKETELRSRTFWAEGFPILKARIMEGSLLPLQEAANTHMTSIGMAHRVEFALLTGSRNGLDITGYDEQGEGRDYITFSKGARRRMALCFALAPRKLKPNHPFGFLIVDEMLDGIDATGVSAFFRLMESLAGQCVVISHRSEVEEAEGYRVLKAVKERGICWVEEAGGHRQ